MRFNPPLSRRISRHFIIRLVTLLTVLSALQPIVLLADTGGNSINQLLNLPIPQTIEFCGEKVPLTREDVLERLDHELVVILGSPVITTTWFKRIPRYFPMIERIITHKGLPQDLKYVALIESSLRANSVSSAGATGPWQFMACTGDSCGLERNSWRDKRRDWQEATEAAISHLADLRKSLGSWPNALAGYNAGATKISSAMNSQLEKDFYGLRLPRETERYVFRAIAAKLIVENPSLYGIRLEGARFYGPEPLTEVTLNNARRNISVAVVAEVAGVSYRRFLELNPAIVGKEIPAGVHRLRIPRENAALFDTAITRMLQTSPAPASKPPANPNPDTKPPATTSADYVVRPGDTLNSIARKHGLRLQTLLELNNLTPKSVIKAGQKLTVRSAN